MTKRCPAGWKRIENTCFGVKKTGAFTSERGEHYPAGYSIVDKYGTKFKIFKTHKEAEKSLRNMKV